MALLMSMNPLTTTCLHSSRWVESLRTDSWQVESDLRRQNSVWNYCAVIGTFVARLKQRTLFALRLSQVESYDLRSLKYSSNKTLVTVQNCYLNHPFIWCLVSLAKTWLSMVNLTFMICIMAGFENWFGALWTLTFGGCEGMRILNFNMRGL